MSLVRQSGQLPGGSRAEPDERSLGGGLSEPSAAGVCAIIVAGEEDVLQLALITARCLLKSLRSTASVILAVTATEAGGD
nr:unnamed protein product [Digitaria exilis]